MKIASRIVVGALAILVLIGIVQVAITLLTILASMNLEGGLANEGDQHLRNQSQQRPQWAAEGTSIVFFRNGVAHIVDAAGSRLELLDDAIFPNVSPDGNRIAYTALERYSTGWLPWSAYHNYEIVSSELDGSDRRRLTETFAIDTRPVWSPDGTRIAFVSLNENYKETVHIIGADGSDARMVVPTIETMNLPAVWSTDGRSIAYLVGERGNYETSCRGDRILTQPVYIAGADGSEPTIVGQGLDSILPTWSPDGRRVVFTGLSEADCRVVELRAVATDGSASSTIILFPRTRDMSRLVYDLGLGAGVSWSPDGSEFLLGSLIVRVDGSAVRSLLTRDGLASWSLDGSRIAVHLPTTGYNPNLIYGYDASAVLYTMASDGSDIQVLVEQDEEGNLSTANGRSLSYDLEIVEQHRPCFELARPGALKYCDEE